MRPSVLCIPYATSSHEKSSDIITFVHFEESNLVEIERNAEEDESILASIYELSVYDNSDGGSINTGAL